MPDDPRRSDLLTIEIEGSAADDGNVRLTEFLEELAAVRTALHQLSLSDTTPTRRVSYQIVDLHHGSPASVALKEVVEVDYPPVQPNVPGVRSRLPGDGRAPAELVERIAAVQQATNRPPKIIRNVAAMEPLRVIGEPLRKHVSRVVLRFKDQQVELDRSYPQHVVQIMGFDMRELGEITGRLERVMLHGRNEFDIYPFIGPMKVNCTFPRKLLEKVAQGLGKVVTVDGELLFKEWDDQPYRIKAKDLYIREAQDGALGDLRGLITTIPPDVTSEDYIDRLRDDDEW